MTFAKIRTDKLLTSLYNMHQTARMVASHHIPERFIEGAKKFLHEKRMHEAEKNRALWEIARDDAKRIIEMIIREYKPAAIYQWGSVLEEKHFREYSDIDIAIEGVVALEDRLTLEKKARAMTEFPVDIVFLEKTLPVFADIIRMKGKKVYESR